jgi:hypothetical protein
MNDTMNFSNCIQFGGVDEHAHKIVRSVSKCRVIIHPPTISTKRAFCKGDILLAEKPYLDRNKDIVLASNLLIATPLEFEEQIRSGTWSTVRFARKRMIGNIVIDPNGNVVGTNYVLPKAELLSLYSRI